MSKEVLDPVSFSQGRTARAYLWTMLVLLVWLLFWVAASWPYSLDDALIHLRYADHLLHQHRITYDGVHASFGTSSLLYVAMLAALRTLSTSPLLPRAVSSVVYVALFAGLVYALYRALHRDSPQPMALWAMAVALPCILVAPSAVRWLDDGMETGLVFADALLAIFVVRMLVRHPRLHSGILLAACLFGFFTVLLRVELLILIACVSTMAALEMVTGRVRRMAVEHPGRVVLCAGMPLAGGLTAAAVIRLSMHALLPDTALAKAFGLSEWRDTFLMTASTVGSSFSFGIGLLLIWGLSVVALLRWSRLRWADLCGNLLFPAVLLAAATRGQQVQGIRYFGWTLFFPLLWNVLRMADGVDRPAPQFSRWLGVALGMFFLVLVPAFVWESRTFSHLFAERGEALQSFRSQKDLDALQGKLGIAEDVGFVGYFTQADLCDPYGLINGRAAAKLKYAQRFDRCMALRPRFAFGSREFLQKVTAQRSVAGWFVCGSYPFDNVRSRDVHYLVVEPDEARKACPQTAQPVTKVLPGLV